MLDDAILNGDSNEENKVIIFDGMTIVNLIDVKKQKLKHASNLLMRLSVLPLKNRKVLAKSE